ncbi:MAG: hydroxypyruvate isomerase family protein [Planctomycetota bacterium]|jgi:hydroxypyruvate isomerase
MRNQTTQSDVLSRRNFIGSAAATALTAAAATSTAKAAGNSGRFKLKYAPNPGMFRQHAGKDYLDNIRFMADEGFSAMFDNGLMGKPVDMQEKIAAEMARRDMTMGPFVLYAEFKDPTFVTQDKAFREMIIKRTRQGVEVAKRTNTKWMLIAPGCISQRMEVDYQTANLIDNLRYCTEIAEANDVVIVIEPLNWWANHPGLFLQKIPQAYLVCRAVNSPACKIVNDLYHQQITEGNLIPNIDKAWSEIGAFHIGDNPGRKEPTSGEINYKNIFKHLYKKGYTGVLCMEHGKSKGNSKQAERALIDAYRACDDFEV